MAFDWSTPTQADLLRALTGNRGWSQNVQPSYADQLQQARETLAQSEQPEQRGGKEQIDGLMERALPQLQSTPQTPNPYAINMARGLVGAKTNYEGAQTDEQRQAAQSQAEFLRNIASNVGLDMSDYGSDVSLQDATRNLASREAREILEAMQGRYSKTADQHYQDKLIEGTMQGLSARQARKYAEQSAQNYQANRVAYLNGAFNAYGRDGRVVNDIGNQILGEMAGENPMLANFYAQIYPNQRDAYQRDNQLEDTALAQTNAFARMAEQYRLSELGAENAQRRGNQDYVYRRGVDSDYGKDNAVFSSNLQTANEERAYQQKLSRLGALADQLGFKGDEKNMFIAAGMGINLSGGKGKAGDDSLKNLKTLHDMLGDREKSVTDQLKALQSNLDADPNEIKDLQAQLADIQEQRETLERTYGALIGATDKQSASAQFTGDFNKDKELIAEMREEGKRRGLSAQQIKQAIYEYMVSQGVDERYAKGAVGLD